MSDHKHEAEQELIEQDAQQAHDENRCEGIPYCVYCLDEWEEANADTLKADEYHERYEENRRGILEKK